MPPTEKDPAGKILLKRVLKKETEAGAAADSAATTGMRMQPLTVIMNRKEASPPQKTMYLLKREVPFLY